MTRKGAKPRSKNEDESKLFANTGHAHPDEKSGRAFPPTHGKNCTIC